MTTAQDIKLAVAAHYGITVRDLVGHSRRRDMAHPRQLAMYLCRKLLGLSMPVIGRIFGGRDHTTVLHAVKCVEGRTVWPISTSESTENHVQALTYQLRWKRVLCAAKNEMTWRW